MYDPRLILPTQRSSAYPPFVSFNESFSPPECEMLTQLAKSQPLDSGSIGNGGAEEARVVESYRKVKTVQLRPELEIAGSNLNWLYHRIRERVQWANDNHYGFDLHGVWQNINYLQYNTPEVPGEETGHYHWHQDFGGAESSQRKLSVIVQLSKPEEYDGCRLHFFTEREFDPVIIGQGDMIVFPSWAVHRVTDITRGERRALVSWISGAPFR